jgi:ADP-ribose pyrophosphatase YjhB (NUDIX family)
MDAFERQCDLVARELAGLRERYVFDLREREVPNDPEFFRHGLDLLAEGWLGDAGAFVTDSEERALFVRHELAPDEWTIPGGGHEGDESIEETARREVAEETGVAVLIEGVWNAEKRVIFHEDDPDRRYPVLRFHFDAHAPAPDGIDIGDDEVVEARWFDSRPEDEVADFIEPRVNRWLGDN